MEEQVTAPGGSAKPSLARLPAFRGDVVSGRVALIGTYLPRRCGIATFTGDLRAALKGFAGVSHCDVYAMTEAGALYDYPPAVVMSIDQQNRAAYVDAARRINDSGADIVCLQHEYGIFGGSAGAMILPLLSALKTPLVTTLHTVLERPDADQRRVLQEIIAHSTRVVVMAAKGRDILRQIYSAPAAKTVVTPHGAPDLARESAAHYKALFGWAGRRVLLTFGLLSPNKGLEHMLAAMPHIVRAHPDALYVILGATHPHLKAREGEAYRERLVAEAHELGLAEHVLFVDAFVDNERLSHYLRATDVYVTPYLNEAQITSGTLAHALALGRAIVSTPYWHAREALADGRGILCPFADADALAHAIDGLLGDDAAREGFGARAYAFGRETTWAHVARRYLTTFDEAHAAHRRLQRLRRQDDSRLRLPPINLAGVEALTDDRGIMQHTVFGVPDRGHGYCLDDAARALVLMNEAHAVGVSGPVQKLARGYAAFVQHAWNDGAGAFRNFMAFDGRWLEETGSGDSFGRAVWALGSTAHRGSSPMLRQWAASLATRVLPHAAHLSAPRSRAFACLGLVPLIAADVCADPTRRLLRALGDDLLDMLRSGARDDGVWFEATLSYDNARLPEALLRAALTLGDTDMAQWGLASLRWLCGVHTSEEGWFRPVGSAGLAQAMPTRFDQQPLEAAAVVDACSVAFELTKDAFWCEEARRAYEWYFGANDLGLALASAEDGICHDGLTATGVNRNQGAESVIAFQAATCAMHAIARDRRGSAPSRAS